jgi:histidine ammonia-lyase
MHAAQAMDLRRQAAAPVTMASATSAFMAAFRRDVHFLERDDQVLTRNIAAATAFIANYSASASR